MCGTCGCVNDSPSVSDRIPAAEGVALSIPDSGSAVAREVPLQPLPRRVVLARNLLERNDLQAILNRERFQRSGVRVVNVLSSPGSGKTALLEALARQCGSGCRQAVIVGDLATDNDARRLQSAGLPAVQISTGQGCHLEASQVSTALDRLEASGSALADLDLLWIENVGNLVCPAAYDLGESLRVVLLSTCEGEDKPLKYPSLFHSADLVLISKVDLAQVVGFDRAAALSAIARVAPRARVLEVSARTGQGLAELQALLVRWPLQDAASSGRVSSFGRRNASPPPGSSELPVPEPVRGLGPSLSVSAPGERSSSAVTGLAPLPAAGSTPHPPLHPQG